MARREGGQADVSAALARRVLRGGLPLPLLKMYRAAGRRQPKIKRRKGRGWQKGPYPRQRLSVWHGEAAPPASLLLCGIEEEEGKSGRPEPCLKFIIRGEALL